MRLPRQPDDPDQPLGRFDPGQVFVMLNRGDYFQCAPVIPKGGFEAVKAQGLDALRERIATAAPFVRDRVEAIQTWEDVKLLSVAVNHLRRWYRPGLLCIGDAAHAMSPIGGVGINLAVQDAVAAANILAEPLRSGTVGIEDLKRVQERRALPARLTQRIQVFVQDRVLSPTPAAQRASGRALAAQAPEQGTNASPHSGAADRDGVSAGACPNACA
jgi:2-polyprenyl-6-methoxyphenol hydroxylase-like FAD-dependent oxidoreductase